MKKVTEEQQLFIDFYSDYKDLIRSRHVSLCSFRRILLSLSENKKNGEFKNEFIMGFGFSKNINPLFSPRRIYDQEDLDHVYPKLFAFYMEQFGHSPLTSKHRPYWFDILDFCARIKFLEDYMTFHGIPLENYTDNIPELTNEIMIRTMELIKEIILEKIKKDIHNLHYGMCEILKDDRLFINNKLRFKVIQEAAKFYTSLYNDLEFRVEEGLYWFPNNEERIEFLDQYINHLKETKCQEK